MPTRVYLSPGMFGFGELASLKYFEHVERALKSRFALRGRAVSVHVSEAHPTASIRRRARTLAFEIGKTAQPGELIHIVGHSTGGLDARLLSTPGVRLDGTEPTVLPWIGQLKSITCINTPHFGTPLAAFFATKSGQELLYAVTALSVIGLKVGAPPLAAASALVAAFGRVSGAVEIEVVERSSEALIRVLDDAASAELRRFLKLIRDDQGAVLQLTPEAMDLFQGSVVDRPGVRYQSVASYAPAIGAKVIARWLLSPWSLVSFGMFNALQKITKTHDPRYPCHRTDPASSGLRSLLGEDLSTEESDGVVPLHSQLWGDIIWVGKADHLDIVGHFHPSKSGPRGTHVDWLRSGSGFDEGRFDSVMDRIVDGMVLGEAMSTSDPSSRRD